MREIPSFDDFVKNWETDKERIERERKEKQN